jgi:hypothetical protein
MVMRIACLPLMLAVAILPAPSSAALDMSVNTGMLLIGTVPPAGTGGPNPAIAYTLGASVRLPLGGELYLEPTLDLFTTWYEWVASAGVAVPALEETGDGFFTLGTMAGLQFGIEHPLSPALSIGGSIGVDGLLRFPISLSTDLAASTAGQAAAPAFFFGMVRFIYPETRVLLRWKVSNTLSLTVGLRAFYPIFHIWDGLNQPFLDQFMMSAGLGFGFSL